MDLPAKLIVPNKDWNPSDKEGNTCFLSPPVKKLLQDGQSYINAYAPSPLYIAPSNLKSEEHDLIYALKNDPNLTFVLTDKNLGPAVMTTSQYKSFCHKHLHDPNVYSLMSFTSDSADSTGLLTALRSDITDLADHIAATIDSDPRLNHKLEHKAAAIITHNLDKKSYAKFYALPKIHKTPIKPRPIVSASNAIANGLSCWLTYQLRPYVKLIDSQITDTKHFLDMLASFTFKPGDLLGTLDVASLYTSIDKTKCVEVIGQLLYSHACPMLGPILKSVEYLLNNNYFTYGAEIYQQRNGAPMGFSHSPDLATLYMHAHDWHVIQGQSWVKFYKRYLDDCFLVLRPRALRPGRSARLPGLSYG